MQRIYGSATVIRGDEVISSQIISELATFAFYARKVGGSAISIKALLRDAGSTSMATTGLLVGGAGHGEIDILLRTQDASGRDSFHDARVRVSAHRARNLLANGPALYVALSPWTDNPATGTVQIIQGSTSLERNAS